MYIAAVRIADEFGCATIGIQYQQGLKDLAPASDLVEGLLNNVDRPPVKRPGNRGAMLFAGEALPHFNEVDECAGLDGLVTYRLWRELGFAPENTLHDVRWGEALLRRRRERFCLGIRDFRRGAARAPASAVTPARRANASRRCISGWAAAPSRASANRARSSGAASSSRTASCTATSAREGQSSCRKEETERRWRHHDAAVADHARGAGRHHARPDDGAAQVQPHPGGLRAGRGGCRISHWPPRLPCLPRNGD